MSGGHPRPWLLEVPVPAELEVAAAAGTHVSLVHPSKRRRGRPSILQSYQKQNEAVAGIEGLGAMWACCSYIVNFNEIGTPFFTLRFFNKMPPLPSTMGCTLVLVEAQGHPNL